MGDEVCPAGLWDLEFLGGLIDGGYASDLIWLSMTPSLLVSLNVLAGLFDIASYIESITRGFGDCQAIVESNATWNGTKATLIC